jgi:hypothetical protein
MEFFWAENIWGCDEISSMSVECRGVLRVPWWCYKFCTASSSINKEENENLECFNFDIIIDCKYL